MGGSPPRRLSIVPVYLYEADYVQILRREAQPTSKVLLGAILPENGGGRTVAVFCQPRHGSAVAVAVAFLLSTRNERAFHSVSISALVSSTVPVVEMVVDTDGCARRADVDICEANLDLAASSVRLFRALKR